MSIGEMTSQSGFLVYLVSTVTNSSLGRNRHSALSHCYFDLHCAMRSDAFNFVGSSIFASIIDPRLVSTPIFDTQQGYLVDSCASDLIVTVTFRGFAVSTPGESENLPTRMR
jgi:hypothetical protein